MLINKILFLVFLTVFNTFSAFGTDSAASDKQFRISCIQLKEHDATQPICDTPYDCVCADKGGIPDEVKYLDSHGLGKTFDYRVLDLGDTPTRETHAYFLRQVVEHKEANFTKESKDDERNTLFVRMQCKFLVEKDSGEKTVNFYLGLFVSGREDYYPQSGVKVSQLLPSCPNNTPVQVKSLLSRELTKVHFESVQKTGYLYSSVYLHSNADSIDIERQKMKELSAAVVGSKKNFIVSRVADDEKMMRFIMHSGKKLDDYGYFVNALFFPEPQKVEEQSDRDLIFLNLFGRNRYDPLANGDERIAPCLMLKGLDGKEIKDGLGNCFFDSEQSFLSILGDEDAPYETDFIKNTDETYKLLRVDLSFYSYRDICRFCRGTFSHMMSKGYLQNRILNFLTNKFDKDKLSVIEGCVFNVLVFAHEKTAKQ